MDNAQAGPSIFLIDDYPPNVALLEGILRRAGLDNIATEIDPREVLPRLDQVCPALVILDLEMPFLTGLQVLSQIRSNAGTKTVPVLILTIDTTAATAEKALAAGAQLVVVKPFDNAELLQHIKFLLGPVLGSDPVPGPPPSVDHLDLPTLLDLARGSRATRFVSRIPDVPPRTPGPLLAAGKSEVQPSARPTISSAATTAGLPHRPDRRELAAARRRATPHVSFRIRRRADAVDETEHLQSVDPVRPPTVPAPRLPPDIEVFRDLTESLQIGFLIRQLDPPEIQYVSPSFERIYGYNPLSAESPDVAMRRILHPEDWDRFRSEYWLKAGSGYPVQAQFRIVRSDGAVRWVRATSEPVVDDDGIIRRTANTAEDITDHKVSEDALRAAEDLAQAHAVQSEFFSRISHELRTPMNAVLGFAQLLELEVRGDQVELVQQILRGGRHLVELIDDILDISTIENNDFDLTVEDVDVADLLRDILGYVKGAAAAADVRLECQIEDLTGHRVRADRRRLSQVLLNVMSNAVKYNRPAGHVRVTARLVDNAQLDILVEDTGRGIDPKDVPRLFTPFDRLGARAAGIEGTGIGLALSRRLMSVMGGNLHASSKVGVGTVFTVSIGLSPVRISEQVRAR